MAAYYKILCVMSETREVQHHICNRSSSGDTSSETKTYARSVRDCESVINYNPFKAIPFSTESQYTSPSPPHSPPSNIGFITIRRKHNRDRGKVLPQNLREIKRALQIMAKESPSSSFCSTALSSDERSDDEGVKGNNASLETNYCSSGSVTTAKSSSNINAPRSMSSCTMPAREKEKPRQGVAPTGSPGIINIISPSPTSETPSSASENSVVDEGGFMMSTSSPSPSPRFSPATGGAGVVRPDSSCSSLSSSPPTMSSNQKQQHYHPHQPQRHGAPCSISSGGIQVRTSGSSAGGKVDQMQLSPSLRSPGNKGSTGGLLESIKESPSQSQPASEAISSTGMDSPTERKRKQRPAPLQIPSSHSSSSLSTGGGSVPDFFKITSHINPSRLTSGVRGLTIVSPLTPAGPGGGGASGAGAGSAGVNLSEFNLTYVNVRTRQNRVVQLPRLVASPLPATSAQFSSGPNTFFTSE